MTAIELLDEEIDWDIFSSGFPETARIIKESLIKFAKYHVKEALEEAKYAAELILVEYEGGEVKVIDHLGEEVTTNKIKEYITVNHPAILEAYPESKII